MKAARKPLRTFRHYARASRADLMLSAGVAELVDALDLGSSDESCGGSSPSARTIQLRAMALRSIECCAMMKQDALRSLAEEGRTRSRRGNWFADYRRKAF
jgi:hypothetical protein